LVFQVLHAERYQRTEHGRPHGPWIDPHPSQPLPQAVFGCDLPPQVPRPLVAGAIAAVHAAVPIYFKGPLLHARANLLLGGWLLDYAEFQASAGRADPGDPVAIAEAWARDHLDARCTVADMARAAKLSLARFKQVYARERTQTPGAFLDGLKVEAACRELRAGLDIRRCARRCGFRSPTAFSAFFRRQLGLPPSQWRRQHRTG
jgi:AraC-like DNA-binding protein